MGIDVVRIRQFFGRINFRPHARGLESELARVRAENARLREKNRALLDSILGIAVPPVYSSSAEDPRSLLSPRAGSEALASTTPADRDQALRTTVTGPVSPSFAHSSAAGAPQQERPAERRKNPAQTAAPLRRRSWHQINRALEFKAARKSPQQNTER